MSPQDLVARLERPGEQYAVGIVLISPQMFGDLENLAARWQCHYVDLVAKFLDRLPADTAFAGISQRSILEALDEIAGATHSSRSALVVGFDVLLARLPAGERGDVWRLLRETFKRRTSGLVMAFPAEAPHLLPADEDARWTRLGRVANATTTTNQQ